MHANHSHTVQPRFTKQNHLLKKLPQENPNHHPAPAACTKSLSTLFHSQECNAKILCCGERAIIHNAIPFNISPRKDEVGLQANVIFRKQYWRVPLSDNMIGEFLRAYKEFMSHVQSTDLPALPIHIKGNKFIFTNIEDLLLVFISHVQDDDSRVNEKVKTALRMLVGKYGTEHIKDIASNDNTQPIEDLIDNYIMSKLKVSLVGEGGVGKTTLLRLLKGTAPPTEYVPTIALSIEQIEATRYGTYSIILWDFAGQERFRRLWTIYFRGSDIVFIITDSTLNNVIATKEILDVIRKDAPGVPVWAIANKQDLEGALSPELVERILGIPAFGMVAIDQARKEEMMQILLDAVERYIGTE
jgi:small GTP-binding protein